jgi:YidC/Oxa1 family membrane protein insertase
MEEKKFDLNSTIGFALIFAIVMYMMYNSKKDADLQAAEKAKQEQIDKKNNTKPTITNTTVVENTTKPDSIVSSDLQAKLGAFAYSEIQAPKEGISTLENEFMVLKVANKGGYIVEAKLKKFTQFSKQNKDLVYLIKNNNASFEIELKTKDNKVLNTKNLTFVPVLTKNGDNQILTLRLKASETSYLEYRYVLKPNDYMLDFSIKSSGLENVVQTNNPLNLEWQMKTYRNEKSVTYENRYTEIVFEYEEGKDDYTGQGSTADEEAEKVSYVAFKQHFFTNILLTDKPFKKGEFLSENLVKDEEIDTVFTKKFTAKLPLEFNAGDVNYAMNWYIGPADYDILNKYDKNLDEVVPLGWGIFGWMNQYIFIPVFGFLTKFFPYGLAIIMLTILVRLVLSPMTYKSYLSQVKMKVLRPEITELNDKYAKDPMKRQQETMKLYGKAGVNPMAGCIPALLQIPVFYALFSFFPSAISLRQKSFLWADDLSSFDSVMNLPFFIPFYGNHISLFPILASIAIFFYMKMTTGDQPMQAPAQEGMPDMGKIMKIMIYISPLMMLFFFNNYASGLSLYYFISNLITIGIMLVIKHYIIDTDKVHAKIQENKEKPKKTSKFQQKLQDLMEQAEQQKKNNQK